MRNDRSRLVFNAAAALMVLVLPAVAWAQQGHPYDGSHMWDGGWHGWLIGPLMMIVFLALAVAVVVLLVRWLGGPGYGASHAPPPAGTALDILKERFARGEIDREEFEERRRVLGE